MAVSIPEPVQEVLDCIAEMNISTTTKNEIIGLRTRITETYTQQWKPQNMRTLLYFLRVNIPAIPFVTDEELILHIVGTGKKALEKRKQSEDFQSSYALFFFVGFLSLAFLISFLGAGKNSGFVSSKIRLLSFVLVIGAGISFLFSRVLFPEIAKHLRDDTLTVNDCYLIMKQLPGKKSFIFLHYGIALILIFLALLSVCVSAKINKSAFDRKYSEVTDGFEANIQEIDRLIANRQFSEAWEMSEECSSEAYEVDNILEELGESLDIKIYQITEAYNSCQNKIIRAFVCGFWIGNSTNSSYPYQIIYVTESDNGYWAFMTEHVGSSEELAQIVESHLTEFFIPAEAVSISKGHVKEVTFNTEDTNFDLSLEVNKFPEEILTIGDREFTRVD